jgi:two-component system cell cycle sensor histidine kinase/response regulator CckA
MKKNKANERYSFLESISKNMRLFVFLFFSFSFAFLDYGQEYLVHHYSDVDGLPSAQVFDVTQDHWGRMWFATLTGISCYDGVSWNNYTQADGLPTLFFTQISVDRKGRIWALAHPTQQGKLLVVFHNGSSGSGWNQIEELKFNLLKNDSITSFQLVEPEGENEPVVVVGSFQSGLFRWQQGNWVRLTTENGLLSNSVKDIAVWQGKCYVATDNGISVLKEDGTIDNRLNRLVEFPSKEIKGICAEYKDKYPGSQLEDSRLWIYGHQWLGYLNLDEGNNKMVLFQPGITFSKAKEIFNLLPDYRGGLYIGSPNGIYYFNYKTGTWESLHVTNGLISEGTYSMFIDFEKNVWIACGRGVSKIASRMFSNFKRVHGLLEDEVTAVLEIEPGKFVLGHYRGLTFWNGNKFLEMPFTGEDGAVLPYGRVLDMKADSKQNIWVTSAQVGLARISKQREIKWYGKDHGLPDNIMINCVWIDEADNVWIGTNLGIFFMVGNGSRFVSIGVGKLPTPLVRKIYNGAKKILYLGSAFNGVYAYENKKKGWKNYQVPGHKGANNVYAMKEDHRGQLLIGTLAGLFTLDLELERLKKFKENDFEINTPVYFIIEDHRHRFWFGTNNGVVRWDGIRERIYSLPEGLVGQETNRAAGLVDTGGRVWIGTNRGLSIYNEQFDDDISWNPPPKIRLLSMTTGDQKFSMNRPDPPVQLTDLNNTVVFHFRGLSFIDEKAIRFTHKLEGFDKEWLGEHYPFGQMIRYSNLHPGRYRFYLKARNALGVWSDEVVSPEIIIQEPFYKSWWFLFLAVLLVGFIFHGIIRFFSQKRYALLLEKQVEERTHQLQAVEKRYQDLFEESKDVVFITTLEGKFVDINPAGVEVLGYQSKEEMLRWSSVPDIYYHPEDRVVFQQIIEKQGYVKDYEITFERKDGEPLLGLVTATLVRDVKNNITGYRGIIRDITEQKKLEQQLIQAQKMEAIGTMAGGIAHDFNNILAVIIGHAELIREDLAEGGQLRKSAEQIVTASERGAELVKQILAFSRQSQRIRKPINLSTVIKESLRLLRSVLPTTIEIRQDIRATSAQILADSTQIHQIMMNFGTNAEHAMREKGGILDINLDEVILDTETVKKYQDINPGIYLRLTVSDTGHGMSGKVIKHIFEPYFTTKETGEGTGMGMAVTHGIVKSCGGDISVTSDPGKGTTFNVLFPKIEEKAELEKELKEKIPGGSERVLLVDDETSLIDAGTQILKRLGYDVVGITDAVAALETVRKDPDRFHLIISDLTMPQLTGIQLAEEIKKINPGISIILCSGFSASLTSEQIKTLGINDFITKPFIRSELAQVIRRVLDRKQ